MKLVANLRNAAQGLAAIQAKQSEDLPGGTRGDQGNQPQLIGGNSTEARAVYLALEQCLFHGIRVKEFGEDRCGYSSIYVFPWCIYTHKQIYTFFGGEEFRLRTNKLVSC